MVTQWIALLLLPLSALSSPVDLPIPPSHGSVRYLSGNNGYGYIGEDHYKIEMRNLDGSVEGVYGYKMPDGGTHMTSYVSDEGGYRLQENDVLKRFLAREGELHQVKRGSSVQAENPMEMEPHYYAETRTNEEYLPYEDHSELDELPVKVDDAYDGQNEIPVGVNEPSPMLEELPVETDDFNNGIEHLPVAVDEPSVGTDDVPGEFDGDSIGLQELPVEIEEIPVGEDEIPGDFEQLPVEVEETPDIVDEGTVELEELPVEVDKFPVEHEQPPVEVDEFPFEHEQLPVEVDEIPDGLDQLPVEVDVAGEDEFVNGTSEVAPGTILASVYHQGKALPNDQQGPANAICRRKYGRYYQAFCTARNINKYGRNYRRAYCKRTTICNRLMCVRRYRGRPHFRWATPSQGASCGTGKVCQAKKCIRQRKAYQTLSNDQVGPANAICRQMAGRSYAAYCSAKNINRYGSSYRRSYCKPSDMCHRFMCVMRRRNGRPAFKWITPREGASCGARKVCKAKKCFNPFRTYWKKKSDHAVALPDATAISLRNGVSQSRIQATAIADKEAYASPVASSYSGKGGMSLSAPSGVAIVGPGGIAIADTYSLAYASMSDAEIKKVRDNTKKKRKQMKTDPKPQPLYYKDFIGYKERF